MYVVTLEYNNILNSDILRLIFLIHFPYFDFSNFIAVFDFFFKLRLFVNTNI